MKFPLFALLGLVSLTACAQTTATSAQTKADAKPAAKEAAVATAAPVAAPVVATDSAADARARAAVLGLAPKAQIDRVSAAPIPGFREVIVGGQVLYISDDGRYLMQGTLFDMKAKKDLSQIGLSVLRRDALKKVSAADRIVFAPANPKHRVAVFTDIECGFCRKLHQDIAEYNRLGIAIEYLAFPRAGKASEDFKKMESVWCSADRRQALTDAKAGKSVSAKRCTSPVAMQYDLGQRIGLQGTPMIINEDGIALPGYMAPGPMLEMLNKLAAERSANSGAAAGGR